MSANSSWTIEIFNNTGSFSAVRPGGRVTGYLYGLDGGSNLRVVSGTALDRPGEPLRAILVTEDGRAAKFVAGVFGFEFDGFV